MYYTSEAVAEMFANPQKVCALCDAGFPVNTLVRVELIDGKPVKDTYTSLSQSAVQRISKEFGVINTDVNIT